MSGLNIWVFSFLTAAIIVLAPFWLAGVRIWWDMVKEAVS